ncbi:hypothetical protein B0H10DRAFT_1998915 [Mycena sp. CBHHK59/15]|nr:hypothetical protein B0H10DRAFT_1998915 [Mycena sp. CBHHK59/15]
MGLRPYMKWLLLHLSCTTPFSGLPTCLTAPARPSCPWTASCLPPFPISSLHM